MTPQNGNRLNSCADVNLLKLNKQSSLSMALTAPTTMTCSVVLTATSAANHGPLMTPKSGMLRRLYAAASLKTSAKLFLVIDANP